MEGTGDFLNGDYSLLKKEHIEVFCRVLNINEEQIERVYENPGRSANNSNVVIVVDDKSYLFRIPGAGTEKFCSREREALAYDLLKDTGLTDKVIYLSVETGVKISKYYENSRIPSGDNQEELKASMETLKKLHKLDIDFPYVDTIFDRMKRYRDFALEVGGGKYYLEGFDSFYQKMLEFEEVVKDFDKELCFTHGDASINNLLITQEHDYPILIDMEFPAIGTRFEDIATFCVDADFRADKILLMTEFYLGRKPTDREAYHVLGLSAVASMMWYSWAAYKSAVEEDNKLFLDFRDDYHSYVTDVYGAAEEIGI